ncbi:MAG: hypothetical protein HY709_06910 [Candidatus Latescibacteria bacterium]|nr:hypothetical protein [Candidatus Latescibacterota bacterium]
MRDTKSEVTHKKARPPTAKQKGLIVHRPSLYLSLKRFAHRLNLDKEFLTTLVHPTVAPQQAGTLTPDRRVTD